MNTSKIKSYAPQARRDFIQAVTERANLYGIFSDQKIESLEIKGDVTVIGGRAFSRKEGELREKLVSRVKREGFQQVMEAYAYTWFNRFVALRYMEMHDYLEHGFRVLSNRGNSEIPELLEHAADFDFQGLKKDMVINLRLAGDKDNELYRLLIVAQCNALHKAMPFLFDSIDSETELLLPDNLLHSNSPIRKLINSIDEESWQNVEIIGWIYQFYISEKKDQVIGKVVKSEDIPAATQLFTPNWIVKYMVQNTLGRMWLATYPDSPLLTKMEYYIEPAEQEPEVQNQLDSITPKELNPEEITFLDPACGSGHILIEAYNIFKEIYLERGYRTKDIPRLILEKNIYGLDICDRAAQLACFAVLMKAREDDRRILDRIDVKLNLMAIQEGQDADRRNVEIFFKGDEHNGTREVLKELAKLFEDGKTFGSLLTIPEHIIEKINAVKAVVNEKLGNWLRESEVQNIRILVEQAWVLAKKYDCVVTNPPYMGSKGMNSELKDFAKNRFTDSKSDLFAMFIERGLNMVADFGYNSMVTMQSWMFLSSYETLRERLLRDFTIVCMVHMANMVMRIAFGTAATIWHNLKQPEFKGSFSYVYYGDLTEDYKPKQFPMKNNRLAIASTADFKKIPGSPIAYWVSEKVREIFYDNEKLGNIIEAKQGLATADNNRFLRLWTEVSYLSIFFRANNRIEAKTSSQKWFPYNKGGEFKKWYGNQEYVVNWEDDGKELDDFRPRSVIRNPNYYFRQSISWSDVTSSINAFRWYPEGFIFDSTGHSAFHNTKCSKYQLLSLCNNKFTEKIIKILNPTMHFHIGYFNSLPCALIENNIVKNIVNQLIANARSDWDSYETSWYFTSPPLLHPEHHQPTLKTTYTTIRTHWHNMTIETQCLEKENNRIFIETYGLQKELTPEVLLSEITLTCNPHYRYVNDKSEDELESLLLTDTIKELISYSIGCMMGRYSLDHPGLIYAHSGNAGFDSSKYKTFPADDDGIIPIMDQDWFPDDATNRFIQFLKVAWTLETLTENLKFVADSLKPKTNESPADTIRRYLSGSFFKDHLKTYKKRPIYWLFSSGKQKAFECLVYLHRYNESTLSRMRSAYVTPLLGHFNARIEFLENEKNAAATSSDHRKLQKEMEVIRKKLEELRKFDDELRHYADMKITLDLDDGVKVNYGKFGNLLAETKAITGEQG